MKVKTFIRSLSDGIHAGYRGLDLDVNNDIELEGVTIHSANHTLHEATDAMRAYIVRTIIYSPAI